jgi:monovalent cation:H+ antiporter, CPA1 family
MQENSHSITIVIIQLSLCLLLFTIIRHYARKSILPAEAWILLSGVLYGITSRYTDVQWIPTINLAPEIVFFLFLPLLIFASGRLVNTSILKFEAVPIGFYAVFGVISSAFIIAVPIAYTLGIPVMHGLILGSALAATDPVAIGSIFQRFKMPEKLSLIVEGESLFNDGTTVVLFHLISSLVLTHSTFSLVQTGLSFVWSIAGAFILGMGLGWIMATLLKVWHDHHIFVPVTLTFVLALTVFLLAEEFFHVSGVVAVLLAAIIFVQKHHLRGKDEGKNENAKLFGTIWDYISVLANSFLFFALGTETGAHPFNVTLVSVIVAIFVMLTSRSLVIYFGAFILRLMKHPLPFSWQNVLNFGGLRGAVSAALILMVPHDYVYREAFLCLAFAMIFFTLVFQPLLMQVYLKKALLPENE